MRRMALANVLLVGASGCNAVFGLNPTQTWDAGDSGPDAPPGVKTSLVFGAVTTDGMGTIDPTITYAGIGVEATRPEVPVVQVGPLDATMGPLADVSYSTADGTFEVPYTLRDAPHRIAYTLPNDPVPHEVQWSETGAYLVVPRYMRMNAPLVPAGSGLAITPQGGAGIEFSKVYTSGTFTLNDDSTDFDANLGTLLFHYADKARPLSKPLGGIESAKGDWVLVTDWATRSGFKSVSGWALTNNVDLVASTLSSPSPQPTWNTGDRPLATGMCPGPNCLPTSQSGTAEARMSTTLGPLIATTKTQRLRYGVLPTADLPPYLPGRAPDFIERSTVLYFAEASAFVTAIDVADPSAMLPFPRAVDALIYASRTVHGVKLTSSMQEIVKDLTMINTFTWKAPLAKSIMLGTTSLSGADDVAFPATTEQVTLSFSPDTANVHDYVITLAELATGTLTPVRVYHVTAATAKIDGSLLQSGHTYVFSITSRFGLPMAAQGDYRVVSFPFSTSTTATATFVVE